MASENSTSASQIIAQFGKSSDQVQSLGLKKKTEYKAPTRRAKST
jgi:hypothetical protein